MEVNVNKSKGKLHHRIANSGADGGNDDEGSIKVQLESLTLLCTCTLYGATHIDTYEGVLAAPHILHHSGLCENSVCKSTAQDGLPSPTLPRVQWQAAWTAPRPQQGRPQLFVQRGRARQDPAWHPCMRQGGGAACVCKGIKEGINDGRIIQMNLR